MIDIVIPDKNEKKFIDLAEKLGFSGLVFLYKKPKDLSKLQAGTKLKLYSACAKGKCDLSIAEAGDNGRHLLEKTKIDFVYGFEEEGGRDHTHYRYSGMNHILAKIAHSKKKIIGFNISKLINASGMKRSRLIGRMMQNIRLYRKYKVKTCAASFAQSPYQMRAANDIMALLRVIGMEPGNAKKAVEVLEKALKS